ncbi:hypothetical protein QFC24_006252 [Naganishia onofrii]|uniref:Uncharacterized protein n=1 Tax=Naganishia onofrii TaxID=1851511 RepID=A0ACC2X551_9TREE|nr:hypothetical protein QFC24_006252 [Naganishia onofrii]
MQRSTTFDIDGIPHRLVETLSDGNCMISSIRFLCGQAWTTKACRQHRRELASKIEEDEFGEEVVETASVVLHLDKDTSATILRTCGRLEDPGTERNPDQLMDAPLTTEECIFIAVDMEVDIWIYRTRNGQLESIFSTMPCTNSGVVWPKVKIWYNGSDHYKALLPVHQEDMGHGLRGTDMLDLEDSHQGTPISSASSRSATPIKTSDTDGNQAGTVQDLGLPKQSIIGDLVKPTELELRHYLLRNNYRLRIGTDSYIAEATTFDGNSMINCILLALDRPYGTGPADALRKQASEMVLKGTLGVQLKDKLQRSAFRSFDFSRGMHNFNFKSDVEIDLLRSMPNRSSMSTYLEAPNLVLFSELLSCRIRVITAKHRGLDADGVVNIIFRAPQDMSADGDYDAEATLLYDGSDVAGHYWLLRRQDEHAEYVERSDSVYPGLEVITPRTAQPSHLMAPIKADKNYQKKFDGKLRRVVGSKMQYFIDKKQPPRATKKKPASPSSRLRKGARAHESAKDKNNLDKLNKKYGKGVAIRQLAKGSKVLTERKEDDLGQVSHEKYNRHLSVGDFTNLSTWPGTLPGIEPQERNKPAKEEGRTDGIRKEGVETGRSRQSKKGDEEQRLSEDEMSDQQELSTASELDKQESE